MNPILIALIVIPSVISFCMGALISSEIHDRRTQQKIRKPAQRSKRTFTVQEYIIQPGALDLHFPNTEGQL